MPFLVDQELCQRVLDAAGQTGDGPADHNVIADLAKTVFSNENRFVTELRDSPVPFEIDRPFANTKNYVVRSGLIYLHLRTSPQYAVVVPPHFVSDHASVPAWARWAIAQSGNHSAGAVVHDWLYAVMERPEDKKQREADRKKADILLRDAMKTSGVGIFKRKIIYSAARLGGANGFGRRRELRFIDPARPGELLPADHFNKAVLRAFTICKRPGI